MDLGKPHKIFFREFFIKLFDVGKVTSKYYIMFHIIPLILRIRKVKEPKKIPRLVAKTAYEYIKSCCFLSFLVGLLRAGLCANWNQSPERILSFCKNGLTQLIIFSSRGRFQLLASYSRTHPEGLK